MATPAAQVRSPLTDALAHANMEDEPRTETKPPLVDGADGVAPAVNKENGVSAHIAAEVEPSEAPTSEPLEDEEEDEEEDDDSEEEESSDDEEVGPDGMTKYERQRQANIQRNKELMMQLNLNKMADKLKPVEPEGGPKKRGPKMGWKKQRALLKPSRGSSRIQRLQEERKHTAWKEVRVDKPLKTHPNCVVELSPQCLGMADASQTFEGSDNGDLLPVGFFAEGEFMSEQVFVWVDFDGKHHVLWGDSVGERQRHVETEEGGCDTPAGATLCILRELQRRRLELLGASPGHGKSVPLNIRLKQEHLPLLDKNAPPPPPPPTVVPTYGEVPVKRGRGRPRKYPPKQPKSHVPAQPKRVEPPKAVECSNCKEPTRPDSRMRHGPNGPNTLCNACGMFWATQGRPRPEGVCEQDYVPTPPDGLENVKPPSRAGRHQLEPTRAKNKEEMYDEELERLIDESELNEYSEQEDASDSERDSEGGDDESLQAANPHEESAMKEAATEQPDRRSFFVDMVKCASAGIVSPAMIGADDFPDVIPEGSPAPRWCPHLYASLPPMVCVTEDAAYEVKANPQGSAIARAVGAVADSDPVKDAGAESVTEYPTQAWYAARSAAVALAGYGGAAAGSLLGKFAIFPTAFALPNMVRPRVFCEQDVDGLTLFGYSELEVQQSLQAQLERYEQKAEAEGPDSAERDREVDHAEAVASLEAAVTSARKAMRNADNRADREARFERAAPRIEMVAEAKILCPPLPKPEKPSKKDRAAGGEGAEPAGFLYEDSVKAIDGREDIPESIAVTCGSAPPGHWLPGGRPKEEKIRIEKDKDGTEITPADYERLGGMGQAKKWRKSIRVAEPDGSPGGALGDHLAKLGAVLGEEVLGRRVALWWPLDRLFYLGTVESFNPVTGEHTVRYDDDEAEDLLLPMQRVKWLPPGTGPAGEGVLKTEEETTNANRSSQEAAVLAARKAAEDARLSEEKRIEEEAKGILSPEGRYRIGMGAFDVWAMRPIQRLMRNSERRKCFEVLTKLREVPDPDDDPDDEEEPPRLLIEPFETLPTPRELPDYYELVRCPVDCRSVERMLRRSADRSYASPWFFACAVELMLTNAQTYNDEDSQIYEEAGMLRRAFHQEMVRQFPGQPLPRPFSVYESCDEPMWVRPSGWVAPTSDADVEDEPDPFEALDWETAQAEDDEERAVARAIKAGGAVYANNPDTLADVARRFGRPGPGRPPTGRPVGRPRKNPIEPVGKVDDDAEFDPKRPNGPRPSSRHGGGGGGGGGGNKRKPGGVELSALAAAARAALEAAGGESLTLDDLVAAAEKAKVPEIAGARRPGSTVLSVLRQHPDVFLEALTGAGARFTLNPQLDDDEEEDAYHGPARTSGRAKQQKRYHEPDEDDFNDVMEIDDEEDDAAGLVGKDQEKCMTILDAVRALKIKGRVVGELFELLPTRKQLPDYYRQIANPVDFRSIAKCLKSPGGYASIWEFLIAVELMFSNAQVYNEENSELFKDAATLRDAFIKELGKAFPGCPYPEPMSVYEADKCVEPNWRTKKSSLKVTMNASTSSSQGGPLKVTMKSQEKEQAKPAPAPAKQFSDCGECASCKSRAKVKDRCLDVQIREQAATGHVGAIIAARKRGAIGHYLEVFWPDDGTYYAGRIVDYDPVKRTHSIKYDADETVETIELWRPEEKVKKINAPKRKR